MLQKNRAVVFMKTGATEYVMLSTSRGSDAKAWFRLLKGVDHLLGPWESLPYCVWGESAFLFSRPVDGLHTRGKRRRSKYTVGSPCPSIPRDVQSATAIMLLSMTKH